MNYTRILIYIMVLAPMAFLACKEETKGPKPDDKRYFSLNTGAWREYNIDSVGRINPANPNDLDTAHFQVREVIDSAYTDGTGKRMYKILRYRRPTQNDPWKLIGIVSAGIEGNEALFQEGNAKYVKLVFPVESGKMWNADLYNSENIEGFYHSRYLSAHEKYTDSAGHVFDSTALVEVNNEVTAINTDYNTERYATGVGLIELLHDSVTTQGKSFWIRKRIVSFGK